jgi:hypothetical protein
MSTEQKISAILQTYLDYIQLEELTNSEIDAGDDDEQRIWDKEISLITNQLILSEALFKEFKQKYKELQKQNKIDDFKVAVAFPQIYQVKEKSRKFRPLFTIDISAIFQGNYQARGWDLIQFTFQPVLPNLMDLYGIDEEDSENLVIREGLIIFLETTFNQSYSTLQDFLNFVEVPTHPLRSKKQPYLLRFDPVSYNYNLKKDLQKISTQKNYWDWTKQGYPAYEYLFGKPEPPRHKVLFLGAFPTHPPTASQAKALKHSLSNSITPVVGPPGNGKTTISLHKVAHQVVKRAYQLITENHDRSNLTLVTSTNNRAVNNLEERLAVDFPNDRFYLSGGSKDLISKQVSPKIQTAINWLEQENFDEAEWISTKTRLLELVNQLIEKQNQYEFEQQQRQQNEQLLLALSERIRELKQNIESHRFVLSEEEPLGVDYSQFPLEAYEQILPYLEQAINPLRQNLTSPTRRLRQNWLVRFIDWIGKIWQKINKSSDRHLLKRLHQQIAVPLTATLGTPFPFQMPLTRETLISARDRVRLQLGQVRQFQERQALQRQVQQEYQYLIKEQDSLIAQRNEIQRRLASYSNEDFYATFYTQYHSQQQNIFLLSWRYLEQEALRRKTEIIDSLRIYLRVLYKDKDVWRTWSNCWQTVYRDLSLVFPVVTSTLHSVRNLFPYTDSGSIDQVIFDEAAMSPQHQAFPVLVRCKQLFIVGDPWQIEPVIPFSEQTLEQYAEQSFIQRGLTDVDYQLYSPTSKCTAYHRAAGASEKESDVGNGILLKEHYRCVPPIILCSDRLCNYGLEIKTPEKPSILGANLIAYHVNGISQNHVNQAEVETVKIIINHLIENGFSFDLENTDQTLGIISPYRRQAQAIKSQLQATWRNLPNGSVGTVHTFQGGERSIIILSTRQSQKSDSLWFINRRPNLLNVAVSRAQELLIVVGDLKRLKEGGYSRMLIEHIEQYGEIRELPSSLEQKTNGYQKKALTNNFYFPS